MPRRVLFVDDEPHVTESLKRALRKEPYGYYKGEKKFYGCDHSRR